MPAVINQFKNTLPKDKERALFKFLAKYKPETKKDKKERLVNEA